MFYINEEQKVNSNKEDWMQELGIQHEESDTEAIGVRVCMRRHCIYMKR